MTEKRRNTGEWLRINDPQHTPNEFNPNKNTEDALSRTEDRVDLSLDGSYSTTELNEAVRDANGNFVENEAPILADDEFEDVMQEENLRNHQLPRQTNEIPADNTTPEALAALIEDGDGKIRTALVKGEFDDEEG